jgi:hypothetical protein
MLSGVTSKQKEDDCFKARLVAVLFEYEKGLDLSNLKKSGARFGPIRPFRRKRSRQKVGALSD